MKKIIFALSCTSVFLLSCKKESGNTGIIQKEDTEISVTNNNGVTDTVYSSEKKVQNGSSETQEHTYRYVASDGSSAHVTFSNSDQGNTISVKSNNKVISAAQTEAWANGAVYTTHDVEIRSEGDNITITQGDNVIELKKARGQ